MRKNNLRLIVGILSAIIMFIFVLSSTPAIADYPERPVTILVGFAPGGSMDLSARALARSAEKILGQPIIIENKTGGTGTVATVAARTNRHFVHLDLSKKYCAISAERVAAEFKQMRLDEIPVSQPESTPAPAMVSDTKTKYATRKKAKRK